MLHLIDIGKRYGERVLFEGLGWHVRGGRRYGLIGPNGVGKSTLLRILVGDLAPDEGTVRPGKARVIGYLPQEVASLAGRSVRAVASEGLAEVRALAERLEALEARLAAGASDPDLMEAYGDVQGRFEMAGGFSAGSRVEEVLCGLGFEAEALDRDCGTFSGGWQMRVALARLLLQQPDLLLLDEPTNHLDLESTVWLEGFLSDYTGTLIIISHDRTFLNRLCTHIAELTEDGVDVYTGGFDSYLEQVESRRELALRSQKNAARRRAEVERFIERFRYKNTKSRQVQSRVKMLEKMDAARPGQTRIGNDDRRMRFAFPQPSRPGRVVLELQDLKQGYGDHLIYEHLDVTLLRDQKIALVGPNGAGKSTLLKLLAGVVPYQGGRRVLGHKVRPAYFAQHQAETLNPARTVLEEAFDAARGQDLSVVRGILGAFLFTGDDAQKKVAVLSGGERSRLALARMLLDPGNVLLLDEPTNHLDMASRAVLESALAEFVGTVVLISHDRHFIDAVVDEVWEIAGGRVTPYPGGYSDYAARRARGERPASFPLHGERPTVIAPSEDVSDAAERKGHKGKAERRRAAEARDRLRALTAAPRKRVEAAEGEIATLESRIAELRGRQADPTLYDDPEAVREVAEAVHAAEAALEVAYAEWEAASEALEAAEAEATTPSG